MAKKPISKFEDKSKNKAKTSDKAEVIIKKSKVATKDDSKPSKKEASSDQDESKNTKQSTLAAKSDAKPQTLKQAAKTKSKSKSKKNDKKQDDDFEDDIDDDFGESEIAEYEDDLKAVEDDEDDNLDEFSDDDDSEAVAAEIYLTDSEGRRLCRVRDCDQVANVEGYCRYHYLLLWKKIQIRKAILVDDKLERYIIALTTRYPDKFLEMIKKDLKTEKDFLSSIAELEIDESVFADEAGDDDAQSFTDEIRGTVESAAIDDDGDY